MARKPETFFEEMKRYVGFTEDDAGALREAGPLVERHFAGMADRFYEQIPHHPEAARVFTGGEVQIARLKRTLETWARGLFSGVYDVDYAAERYKIGVRHVLIGLPQRYMISAMAVVRDHLKDRLAEEIGPDIPRLRRTFRALDKILNLDLNLMCESYFQESVRTLNELNRRLEQANMELAELSRVKTEFLAGTSHELRTPLNSILGFTRLILDGLCESREEERELQRDILHSAEHLLAIVNDILDVARIEAGKLRLTSETVDLKAILAEGKSVISIQAAEKKLTVVDETEKEELPLAIADRVRVRQVVLNLLSNAVKFTDKGWITIRARRFPERGYLEIDVEDTGVGIALEKQPLLFEKFRQVDSSFTRQHGGSGLGLAISRKLVEMMGGRIRLRSAGPGCGTTVTFSLPLSRAAGDAVHVAGEERIVAAGDEAGARVLVVDNDPEFRRYLKTLLVRHGYHVLSAATADDAADAARRFRPQFLIVDLALPQRPGAKLGDGGDVIAQFQTGALTREVHCFVVTGYEPADVHEAIGPFRVKPEIWQKPLDAEKFLERLETLRRRAGVAAPSAS